MQFRAHMGDNSTLLQARNKPTQRLVFFFNQLKSGLQNSGVFVQNLIRDINQMKLDSDVQRNMSQNVQNQSIPDSLDPDQPKQEAVQRYADNSKKFNTNNFEQIKLEYKKSQANKKSLNIPYSTELQQKQSYSVQRPNFNVIEKVVKKQKAAFQQLFKSFQLAEELFVPGQINQNKNNKVSNIQTIIQTKKPIDQKDRVIHNNIRRSSSFRKDQNESEFNLQLTMKSRQSKNSFIYDRHDSLIYSNTTSFGVNNSQNRPNELKSRTSLTRNVKSSQLDQINIDKTSSKGEVQNHDRQFSANSHTGTQRERMQKYPPLTSHLSKSGNRNSSSQKQRQENSPKQAFKLHKNQSDPQEQHIEGQQHIKQLSQYQVLPLMQEGVQIEKENSLSLQNQLGSLLKITQKAHTFRSYKKVGNSRIIRKNQDEMSVFSSQIKLFQGRISRVKQQRLLQKKKLQQQLRKINQEIETLKLQEMHSKQKQKHQNRPTQNTIQSRIKIDDNQQQKRKAIRLVRNLKAQKQSRQHHRKKQLSNFDKDLHMRVQDIVKLKYFNQQRVKQKKRLQIIQRMKRQQLRKIENQKQKKESLQFLSKLRNNFDQNQSSKQESKLKRFTRKIYDSPKKKTEMGQVKQAMTSPNLQKKKIYLSKIRNFTVIKKGRADLYEQMLN